MQLVVGPLEFALCYAAACAIDRRLPAPSGAPGGGSEAGRQATGMPLAHALGLFVLQVRHT